MKSRAIFLLLTLLVFLLSCKNEIVDKTYSGFVYIDNNEFKLNNEPYYPIMLNYVVGYRCFDDGFYLSPIKEYENPAIFESNNPNEVHNQLEGHFQLIKEMGFNSVRICFDRISKTEDNRYFYPADDKKYYISTDYEKILDALDVLVNIATSKDLKIMLLIKTPIDSELEDFAVRIMEKFKNNPTIFAYDMLNEPLYFDTEPNRKKEDAYKIVDNWRKLTRKHAPNQLFTIAFSEPIEVFEWDPSILPVDFVQIHTYHPLRVKNEIYWYHKYVNRPFMIGETALPADGDSITYSEQLCFMREVFRWQRDCGSIGFGWWQFQEVPDIEFEAHYTGLLNQTGETSTSDGKHTIIGTVKPAAKVVAELNSYKPQTPHRPENYYNMVGYKNICIKGKILDEDTKLPIEGAVIRGWNKWWVVGMNTYSDENGEFRLYCNDPCVHFEISAPGMSKQKINKELIYKKITSENYDINNLPDKDLEYQKISYKPFLVNNTCHDDYDNPYFVFDSAMFDNKIFEADFGVVYLKNLNLN